MASSRVCCLPVVVILGSTGTGKSKLAIEIARKLGGEIVSADSMQVYKGLDIITNKVSPEEMALCPHHMLGFVPPLKEFSVVEYKNLALPLIYDIKKRGNIPIIVGGTNYYIESLLWDILIDQPENSHVIDSASSSECEEDSKVEKNFKKRKQIEGEGLQALCDEKSAKTLMGSQSFQEGENKNINSINEQNTCSGVSEETSYCSTELYEKLKDIDPAMADRVHPNDSRKIARSLQVFQQTGVRHSELIAQQQKQQGGNVLGGPLRFDVNCVFWLQCEREVLNERLDKRVDEMLQKGLLKELLEFHVEYNQTQSADYKKRYREGIFQSIGFKEFHPFLIQPNTSLHLGELSEGNKKLLDNCIDTMKNVTRRYAKKQITWVRNRFLGRPRESAPDVYGLDTTDLGRWRENVFDKALIILTNIMEGHDSPIKPLPRISFNYNERKLKYVCQQCDNRIIIGEENWKRHQMSRSHKWHVKRNTRKSELY